MHTHSAEYKLIKIKKNSKNTSSNKGVVNNGIYIPQSRSLTEKAALFDTLFLILKCLRCLSFPIGDQKGFL